VTACAAAGCSNEVPAETRPGRPSIYCSPACRPSFAGRGPGVTVTVGHEPTPDNTRPSGRIFFVQLRNGKRSVVVASEIGRPSAEDLARRINEVLHPRAQGGEIG
jgi:hypothetical protein